MLVLMIISSLLVNMVTSGAITLTIIFTKNRCFVRY